MNDLLTMQANQSISIQTSQLICIQITSQIKSQITDKKPDQRNLRADPAVFVITVFCQAEDGSCHGLSWLATACTGFL